MRLRIAITIISLMIYVGLFNLYILKFLDWTPCFDKLFYNFLTFGSLFFAVADLKFGFVNEYHKQFNMVLFTCIFANYLLIILVITEVLNYKNPQPMFYAFNGSVLFVTITIFFNELKYKVMGDPD